MIICSSGAKHTVPPIRYRGRDVKGTWCNMYWTSEHDWPNRKLLLYPTIRHFFFIKFNKKSLFKFKFIKFNKKNA